ncbi:STAS domain-containing protein [Krasilnikovia sp. MM14-A1004]|uniref:STAS domain-containing protein n=1 Tax=Krasilnikovia sp. MM14-A1004 TaxID=3373541 RepID=UPI00399D4159
MSEKSGGEVRVPHCGPGRFGWTQRQIDGGLLVEVAGELDLSTVPELRRRLSTVTDSDAAATIVLDLSDVRFIDAQSTGLIICAWAAARARGRELCVDGLRGIPARVFGVLGVENTLTRRYADSEGSADGRRGRADGTAEPQCSVGGAGPPR